MPSYFGIVYKAINKINGKIYIGQTIKSLEQRKRQHESIAKTGSSGFYFYSALRKYGLKNFDWIVLCECVSKRELNEIEIYYIGYYDTYNNGYNLTLGGEGSVGRHPSMETKQKVSGKNHPFFGKKRPKHSEKMKGKNNPNFGKTTSKEICRKISNSLKGKNSQIHSKEHIKKRVEGLAHKWLIVFPNEAKKIIKNLAKFCRNNNLNDGAMNNVAQGKWNSHKKFKCKKLYEFEIRRKE